MTRKLASGPIHQVSCMRENSAVPSTEGEIHVHVQCMHVYVVHVHTSGFIQNFCQRGQM